MICIGIDPGKKGAIAKIYDDGELVTYQTPLAHNEYDLAEMCEWANDWMGPEYTVAIEQAHAFPRIGARTNFEVGRGFGLWLGILAAKRVKVQVVPAQTWQKVVCAGVSVPKKQKKPAKAKAFIAAQRLWPDRFKVSQDGEIDAALIAEWCRREFH